MKNHLTLFLLSLAFFTAPALPAGAQSCTVTKDYGDGEYLVKIGDKTLLVISEQHEKKINTLSRDLLDAQREIAKKDMLLAGYEKIEAQYKTTLQQQKEYVAELEAVVAGYKRLVADYKKLKEPWVTVEAGVGATSGDTEPAVMLGLGVRAFKVWGFFQEKNSGALVGLSLPLF